MRSFTTTIACRYDTLAVGTPAAVRYIGWPFIWRWKPTRQSGVPVTAVVRLPFASRYSGTRACVLLSSDTEPETVLPNAYVDMSGCSPSSRSSVMIILFDESRYLYRLVFEASLPGCVAL